MLLEITQFLNSIKAPFRIYAYFNFFLKKLSGYKKSNLEKSDVI